MAGILQGVVASLGGATFINASTTGAAETTSGNYKIAVFNGSGSFVVSSVGAGSSESNTVEYLVVAGGGSGGKNAGAGGGAARSGALLAALVLRDAC
jgi:hypothetical protein